MISLSLENDCKKHALSSDIRHSQHCILLIILVSKLCIKQNNKRNILLILKHSIITKRYYLKFKMQKFQQKKVQNSNKSQKFFLKKSIMTQEQQQYNTFPFLGHPKGRPLHQVWRKKSLVCCLLVVVGQRFSL